MLVRGLVKYYFHTLQTGSCACSIASHFNTGGNLKEIKVWDFADFSSSQLLKKHSNQLSSTISTMKMC